MELLIKRDIANRSISIYHWDWDKPVEYVIVLTIFLIMDQCNIELFTFTIMNINNTSIV